MPAFGIDNVEISVRSTAPTIEPVNRERGMKLAARNRAPESGSLIKFSVKKDSRVSLGVFRRGSDRLVRTLLRGEWFQAGRHEVRWDGRQEVIAS